MYQPVTNDFFSSTFDMGTKKDQDDGIISLSKDVPTTPGVGATPLQIVPWQGGCMTSGLIHLLCR
jgi:hypothetical protein